MTIQLKFSVFIRTLAVVLLFAMFHYVVGYRLMYSLGILYTKDEAKVCMVEKNKVKKITLSASDYNSLKWTEEKKEFSLNNQMYDVVSIQKSGVMYTITIYADNPETELITAFHHFESELFHPDQSNKSTKSADDIMSAFQKDCTPVSGFKINIFALDRLFQPITVVQQQPLQISNTIWHPPTTC